MGKHYAFSDIHGNYNLFKQIKKFLKNDDICYVLGDCADRGNDGYRIIREILEDERFVYIKGNHEQLFILAILEQEKKNFHNWFINGGKTTFEEFRKDGMSNELVETINNLSLSAIYTNQDGITYVMTHSGFEYESKEENRECLWNRKHFYNFDNIPKNIILVHGHTPSKYLQKWGVKGKMIGCENYKNEKPFYSYNNDQKLDIDCGAVSSKFIAIYCLDDYKAYGFYEIN